MQRSKIAIVHPQLGFGGSEARALWGIEALKRDYEVTLITSGRVDLNRLNAYYGTQLNRNEFHVLLTPMPLGLSQSARFAALRGAFLRRFVKRAATKFDVIISAYNCADFGVPGIQFIADFSFIEEWRNWLDPTLQSQNALIYGKSIFRQAYLGLCTLISPVNRAAWKKNTTVANSDWSGNLMRREFGIESRTVYPPVAEEFPSAPWSRKENGFVCLGRIVPEKRMDVVIRILERVRHFGHDVHLHILGGVEDSSFGRKLKTLAARRPWVLLEGRTFSQRKRALLVAHRFGINGRENEPFGIAPAELVKAGAITFVPASGGQQEIVNHPLLTFDTEEEAANKIATVLSSSALQETLRVHLAEQAGKFSTLRFKESVREVVDEFLSRKEEPVCSSSM